MIRLSFVIGYMALLCGASAVSAQEKPPPAGEKQDESPIRYEAEEGVPNDKAGEMRRDYAVLEAALNDLASPKNPEYKYQIQRHGPKTQIIMDVNPLVGDVISDLDFEDLGPDHEDIRNILKDIQDGYKRRDDEFPMSLEEFKPASPNIILLDLDGFFDATVNPVKALRDRYPAAWGFVSAYPPAYSKSGDTAVIVFNGGPNGDHGLSWTYVLARKGKRWEVQWRRRYFRD